jgi:hypothetical protein
MTKLVTYVAVPVFAAALLGAGCGGDDDDSGGEGGEAGEFILHTGGTAPTGGTGGFTFGGTSGAATGGSGGATGGTAGSGGSQAGGAGGSGGSGGTQGGGTGGATGGSGTGGGAEAGAGGEVQAGAGGEVQAGAGGEVQAGAGGEGQAGAGGEVQAGAGGEVQAGAGGEVGAGAGGEGQAGAGGQGAVQTVTITDLEDASITSEEADQNLGDLDTLVVDGQDSEYSDGSTSVLIKPATGALDVVPAGATIVSAYLLLYQIDPGDDIEVYVLTEDWSQDDVTYADAPEDGELVATVSGDNTDEDLVIDITDVVADWIATGSAYGLHLEPTDTGGNDFNSTEAGGPEDERPRIVIEYTE